MAYGNVLGYTPASQPGAYNFQQANGQNILLSGPPAESLKARLDAASQFAAPPVAGPGGGVPADSVMAGSAALDNQPAAPPAQAGPAMSVAPPEPAAPNASVAPAAPPAPAAAPPVGVEGVPPMLARPPESPGYAPVMEGPVNTGMLIGPDGKLKIPVAPTAAVTTEGLLAKKAGVVEMPHSASETVSGGFDPSQQYLDTRHALAEQKGALIDKTASVEADNAVREKQLADQQAAQAAQWQKEEQARTDQITAQVQKDLAIKDQYQKEYANAKVDPRRLFSGQGGTARAIGAALAAGLGQAGSGMMQVAGRAPTPNLAYQAIQAAIDRDISAQENEIKIKGDTANNALSQYVRSGLSLDQAKSALRSAQLGWTAAQNQQSAALTKGSMVGVNAQMQHNQLSSAMNEEDENYRQRTIGTKTVQVASQAAYTHAGSAGGFRDATPTEAHNFVKQSGETAATGVETQQKEYNLAHPKQGPLAAKQGGALADVEAAKQAVIAAAVKGGMEYKDGKLSGAARSVDTTGSLGNKETKDYVQSLRDAAPLVTIGLGAKRLPNTEETQNWASGGHTISGETNTMFLQDKLQQLEARERAIRAGGGGVADTAPAAEAEPAEQ